MTRRTARLIWVALVVTPFLFAGVSFTLSGAHRASGRTGPAFWIAALLSAANVALSRLLPPRLGPWEPGHQDAVAFTRALVGFALCDAAALAPLVAFIVTRDVRLLALVAFDVLALILLYPTEARWRGQLPARASSGRPRRARGVR